MFSVKDCNLRHSGHEKMRKRSKPTHTLRELCKLPEIASVLKEKPSGKEIREFLEKHSCVQTETQSTG